MRLQWIIRSAALAFAILAAGAASSAPVATLDPSFGSAGIVNVPLAGLVDATLQADGKILVREVLNSTTLTRFNRDGSIDATFGSGGTIRPVLGTSTLTGGGNIALLPDGRILLAGATYQPGPAGPSGQAVLARFLPDGSLDMSFGVVGFAVLSGAPPEQGFVKALVRSDGSIVVLDITISGGHPPMFIQTVSMSLETLSINGAHQSNLSLPCSVGASVADVALQVDDKVVALVAGGTATACIARFNRDGSLDPTFGTAGVVNVASGTNVFLDGSDPARGITIQNVYDGTVIRLLSTGELDQAFGDPQHGHAANVGKGALGFSCAGKILLALVGGTSLQLARYNSNGTPDSSFNPGVGSTITLPVDVLGNPARLLLRDDGTILSVGAAHLPPQAVASFLVAAVTQADCTRPAAAGAVPVIEYYNAGMDHYFLTRAIDDMNALDSGQFAGWTRTGYTFAASATGSLSPVCRFYIPPPFGDSHFFSASAVECSAVQSRFPQFVLETSDAMNVGLPDPATGTCTTPASVPIYRLWDKRLDTNHRYTTDRGVRDAMVAQGWLAEGYGPDAVAMCALTQ